MDEFQTLLLFEESDIDDYMYDLIEYANTEALEKLLERLNKVIKVAKKKIKERFEIWVREVNDKVKMYNMNNYDDVKGMIDSLFFELESIKKDSAKIVELEILRKKIRKAIENKKKIIGEKYENEGISGDGQ